MGSANATQVGARVQAPGELSVGLAAVQGPNKPCHGVLIRGRCPGQEIFIGISAGVTAADGFPLADGENISFEVSNLNKLFFISGAAAQAIRYVTYQWV